MATTSYFTDKLAPETRIAIYAFVFGSSEYAKRSSSQDQAGIDTAILSTCRQISKEALETFYNTRTVRLNVPELTAALSHQGFPAFVRNIQIVDAIHSPSPSALRDGLLALQKLPTVRTITITSDCLMYGNCKVLPPGILEHPDHGMEEEVMERGYALVEAYDEEIKKPSIETFISVRKFVELMGLGKATCIDIGRYKLDGKYKDIEIVHTKLLRLWPEARDRPDDFRALTGARSLVKEWDLKGHHPMNYVAIVSQTSFKLWVGLFELATGLGDHMWGHPNIPYEVTNLLDGFLGSLRHTMPDMIVGDDCSAVHESMGGSEMHKLGPGSDPSLLERVTECMSRNIGSCTFTATGGGEEIGWDVVRPYWCELEGGELIGLIKHKERLASHERSMEWVREIRAMIDER